MQDQGVSRVCSFRELRGSVCSSLFPGVLVHSGCYNKVLPTGCLINNSDLFLTVPEAGKSKHQGIHSFHLVGACFLVHRCWLSSHVAEGSRDLFGGAFYEGINPIHGGFASSPWVLGFQHEFGGYINV